MASKIHLCGSCKKGNKVACVYCSVCKSALCEECKKEHGLVKLLKNHRLRDIAELPSMEIWELLKSLIVCPNHETEEVVYLCEDHDVTCCSKCVIADHRKCDKIRELADIRPNLTVEGVGLKKILQELNKKGNDLIEHENKHRILINETEMQAMALLKYIKDKILEAYINLEKKVMSSISEKKEKATIQFDKQTACVQKFQTEVERQTCFVNQVAEFGSNVQVNLMERKLQQEIVVRLQDVAKDLELNSSKTEFSCIISGSFEKYILDLRNALQINDTVNVENETSSDEYTDSDRLAKFKETIRNTLTNVHLQKKSCSKDDKNMLVLHEKFLTMMEEDGCGIFFIDEETSYCAEIKCEVKLKSPTEIHMYMPDLNSIECQETIPEKITFRFVEKGL